MLCSDIEASDVARYQQRRSEEGAAGGTINLEVATLRAILRRLGLWARIQPEVRMLPEGEGTGRALTAAEEERLLKSCAASRSRALYPAVVVALNTGLRLSELTGLRWRQVDFQARGLVVGKSKTEAGRGRPVPLNDRALAALRMWAERFLEREAEHFVFRPRSTAKAEPSTRPIQKSPSDASRRRGKPPSGARLTRRRRSRPWFAVGTTCDTRSAFAYSSARTVFQFSPRSWAGRLQRRFEWRSDTDTYRHTCYAKWSAAWTARFLRVRGHKKGHTQRLRSLNKLLTD